MKTLKELCRFIGISKGSARYWILKLGIKGKTRIVGGRAVKFYRKTDIAKITRAVMGKLRIKVWAPAKVLTATELNTFKSAKIHKVNRGVK